MKRSRRFRLCVNDFMQGLIVASGTAAITVVGKSLEAGVFPGLPEIKVACIAALSAGCVYLAKNLLRNTNGDFKSENKE